MKSVLFALFAAATLVACGKKEEAKPVETPAVVAPAPASTPAPAPAPAPAASEPAKTEEVKK